MGGCLTISIISQLWDGEIRGFLLYLSSFSCGRGDGRLLNDIYHQSAVGWGNKRFLHDIYYHSAVGGENMRLLNDIYHHSAVGGEWEAA